MQWIISVPGLAILFLLAWSTRGPRTASYRYASLESGLQAHLSAVAARPVGRRKARLRMPAGLRRRMERSIRFLNRLPADELLPASRWLCDNGRFLQEEAVALRLSLGGARGLPAAEDGRARILCFAGEFLGHGSADLRLERLGTAMAAWQKVSAFATREMDALPLALRLVLLTVTEEIARLCANEQRELKKARRVKDALLGRRERAARRWFRQNRHSAAFLVRLFSELQGRALGEQAAWLHRYFHENDLSPEKLAAGEHARQTESSLWAGNAIASLRTASRAPWHRLLEEWSVTDAILRRDPVYPTMDRESRAFYRARAARVARRSGRTEGTVCEAALELAGSAPEGDVAAHAGYYLLDDGLERLYGLLQANRPGDRLWGFARGRVPALLCGGSLLCALWLLGLAAALRLPPLLWPPFLAVFWYGAYQLFLQAASRLAPPRMTPRLKVERLTDETRTLVVCPTMLLSAQHAIAMVKRLSALHSANPDPRLHFMLLGDFRDSLTGTLSDDEDVMAAAAEAIHALKEDTGHPFFYFQRQRVYHAADHVYMSRERKRGSLETLLKLLCGQPVEDAFARCTAPPERLQGQYRYVITLDSDTLLPPGSALRMVGAMLHPLQQRRECLGKPRGVSVVQPRMEVAAHRVGSLLSLLLGGQGGADPYNAAASDFDHDVLRNGSFLGKGIIDPPAFLAATEGKIRKGAILSHDLLEGQLAGCAYASDIVLYDGHPATLRGLMNRLSRWTRGDWQLLPYVFPLFPSGRKEEKGALDPIGRRKVWLNLIRSLVRPMQLVLLLYAAATGRAWLGLWTLLLPEARFLLPPAGLALRSLAARLAALPVEACVQADAVARTLYRLFFSRQKLLQWTTTDQLGKAGSGSPLPYLYINSCAGAVLAALSLWSSGAWLPGLALALWWAAFPLALPLLEQPYQREERPTEYMKEVLGRVAAGTLLFFETTVTDEDHALPPDNAQIDPNKGISHRTSPTNIGLYLAALLAAEKLRLLPVNEMARRFSDTLDTLERLEKWEGHLYNWYDTRTLSPLEPRFVSSVDSGNYATCLLTCAQGLRALARELPEKYRLLPARLDALAYAIRFQPLYDFSADLFFIGLSPDQPGEATPHYDLLASEARLLSYVSIMMGQIPVKHWYRLGRARAYTRRGQTLLSYSGTMFEYMMPLLFHPLVRGTLLDTACRNALFRQRARRLGGAFGVSESGYYAFDPELYYQYKAFGIPALALDPDKTDDVLAPYASALALGVDLKSAFSNLLKLQALGLEGPLGYMEAADFNPQRIGQRQPFRIVRSHMAHHQGMILLSVCNALENNYIVRLFSGLPRAQAYRLLLEEKPGRVRGVIRRPLRRSAKEPPAPSMHAQRQGRPLGFPVDAHLLHGGGTTLLINARGGGYLAQNGLMLTRFHESCHLPGGLRLYLRDSQSGAYWCCTDPALNGDVRFETAQAVFAHQRAQLATTLRVFVNPLDGAALHCLTLENQSATERMAEVCSYLEPALCPQRDDEAHPAFQNLFIRTQRTHRYGLAALRRPRDPEQPPVRLWHLFCCDVPVSVFHAQSDRTAFLGRGRSVYHPRELELPIGGLADTAGDMIEPCLSLRAQFVLPAGGRAQFVFATLAPGPRDTHAAFLERYDRPESALRRYETAATQGLVTARYLGLPPEKQNLLSRLCGSLCYTGQPAQFRHAEENRLPLRELWAMGLSGDLPILLLECQTPADLETAELFFKAHAWYRISGLWVDLVFLTGTAAEPDPALGERLREMAEASHSREATNRDGGVHVLDGSSLSPEQRALLFAAARVAFSSGEEGPEARLSALESAPPPAPEYLPFPEVGKAALPPGEELLFDNGYGGFSKAEGNYVITLPPGRQTPAPWCNPLCSERFGTLAGESGLIFSYAGNSHNGRLTRWPNDSVCPRGEENFFLRDETRKLLWSVTRYPLGAGLPCRVTHGPGETLYETAGYGIYARLSCFTDEETGLGARVLLLKNEDKAERILTFRHTCAFHPGVHGGGVQLTCLEPFPGGLGVRNPQLDGYGCLCGFDPAPALCTVMSVGAFQGLWGMIPDGLSAGGMPAGESGNVAMLSYMVQLKPGESKALTSLLGWGDSPEALKEAVARFAREGATQRLHRVKQVWEHRLSGLSYDLPDPAFALMLNRWLPYQVLASRLMMRAGFYQAGGAYGFRDQLQDMLSQLHTDPERVRRHLLLCAAHQFEEGDVQHWWHPPRYGVRTRISDDLLFLPYVTAIYVQATGDKAVLDEAAPYLREEPLREGQRERLSVPEVSPVSETLAEHCLRAIRRVELGARGLPLMGGGDWNDGMNFVGGENGESVWLGMFFCEVLRRFAPLCQPDVADQLREKRRALLKALDRHGWDGAWYLRGWYDHGEPLGSSASSECRIDALPQSWAVLAGLSRERCGLAMENLWRMLYQREIGILKLFAPPFDGAERPGYIAGYLPGVRENGGQYTHAVPWAISALYQLGQHQRAWELASAMLPVRHAQTRQQADRYRVEPYALAGDIYANPQQRGRGGWTWYTGSASWYQYVLLEQLFGFQKIGNTLRFRPVLPEGWEGVRLTYRFGGATYHLHASRDCPFPTADGQRLREGALTLTDDGRIHEARFPARG